MGASKHELDQALHHLHHLKDQFGDPFRTSMQALPHAWKGGSATRFHHELVDERRATLRAIDDAIATVRTMRQHAS